MTTTTKEKTMDTTTGNALHPGTRLLLFVLRDLADEHGEVYASSSELLRRTGWANKMSLRRHMIRLERAGEVERTETYREDGGRGPNRYRLKGDTA